MVTCLLLSSCSSEAPPDEPVDWTADGLSMQCTSPGYVRGVDVSDHQGYPDWNAAKRAGIHFGFAKATQGTYNTNVTFPHNWREMKAAGVVRGAYHFFDPTQDGAAQARHFLSVMGTLEDGDMPPTLDLECPDGNPRCLGPHGAGWAPADVIRRGALAWLNTVEAATGRVPMIYTGNHFFPYNGIDITGFDRYPLFLGRPSTAECMRVGAPWTTAKVWQYDWHGIVPGIRVEVDIDRFMGTMTDLLSYANGTAGEKPPWSCDASAYQGAQYWTCNGAARYRCTDGAVPERETCPNGCVGTPQGQDDVCRTIVWACDVSSHQGRQLWTCNGDSRYRCSNGVPERDHCPNGCISKPAGVDDVCR